MHFNMDLLYEIREQRKNKGLPVEGQQVPDICVSSLIGKQMICCRTKKGYTVEKVVRHWYKGYYFALLLVDGEDSHRVVLWKNINCEEQLILNSIEEIGLSLHFEDNNF